MGKGECECEVDEYGQVDGLGRGLGFVWGQTIWLRLGQNFLSESSASDGESMGCSRVPRHKYRGLFCGYEMVEDYNDNSLER